MNYSELLRALSDSDREDWLFNDERSVYTYKENLNIRIEKKILIFKVISLLVGLGQPTIQTKTPTL